MNLRNWEKNQIESNSIRNQNNCYKYTVKIRESCILVYSKQNQLNEIC